MFLGGRRHVHCNGETPVAVVYNICTTCNARTFLYNMQREHFELSGTFC